MSICVAIQSALFYYLACTPCLQLRHEHRTQKKAKKERKEKARIIAEQPHLYRHPDPYNTNPYWAEEIRMGPCLPKKNKPNDASKSQSQRGLMWESRDGVSIATGSTHAISMAQPMTATPITPTTEETNNKPVGFVHPPLVDVAADLATDAETETIRPDTRWPSSTSGVPEQHDDAVSAVLSKTASATTVGTDWNMKRYQREDEELWGYDDESIRTSYKFMDAIKQAGSSAGRYVESKLGLEKQVTEEDRYNFYFSTKNPPVNDYHPPVVSSKPSHKNARAWMLQPPPPAKVMEGKVPVSRSASTMSVQSKRTMGSTMSTDGRPSLGRIVGDKALEAKIQQRTANGDGYLDPELYSVASTMSRARSKRATNGSMARRTSSRLTTRSQDLSTGSDGSDEDNSSTKAPKRRTTRRRSNRNAKPDSDENEEEDAYISKSPESLSSTHFPPHAAQRPKLPTIKSAGDARLASEDRTLSSSPKVRPTSRSSTKLVLQDATNSSSSVSSSSNKMNQKERMIGSIDSGLAMHA
ncbi:hypothetical protein GE21DRAFT_1112 [Neurospora crassa]|uniref:Signal peptide-containing protein n=1 Tax=Neurospora crassa (strain ATCC 24698 / 74-OR23-1A / CBS 708.71 / DSM 1257 / FGSC 987) TaxID=367110 RepID=Q7SDS8_NEUCR|nr:hypothetical protein NCU03082 [Neurospora crassa OR74A]EAA34939.1 hypothetical protein NCU03082 [Neurospora crassa OR74A]KHE82374.1 hypothetical protein GE21DRAFT_1112 [Neurospora crassa]|eukprot:XP_964175.1 hypothetical protein NCU03082 [Neurospora crassa OR74A]